MTGTVSIFERRAVGETANLLAINHHVTGADLPTAFVFDKIVPPYFAIRGTKRNISTNTEHCGINLEKNRCDHKFSH
jgi:uncharacterized protein YceK